MLFENFPVRLLGREDIPVIEVSRDHFGIWTNSSSKRFKHYYTRLDRFTTKSVTAEVQTKTETQTAETGSTPRRVGQHKKRKEKNSITTTKNKNNSKRLLWEENQALCK